jgi:hypothetical protein
MIELHRKSVDNFADELEDKFRDLVLSYRTKIYPDDHKSSYPLPHIREGEQVIHGDEHINDYLTELEKELEWQRSLSGDGCYIPPGSDKIC